jgi:hypothetical protein
VSSDADEPYGSVGIALFVATMLLVAVRVAPE